MTVDPEAVIDAWRRDETMFGLESPAGARFVLGVPSVDAEFRGDTWETCAPTCTDPKSVPENS
ncbi:DUF6229 family protein [Streptomyces sp. NPDC088748]|uniref:DUF6229 family protein n=1 Tax=Streptomyces sp. NPDC088748 TaxID=3365887 RepID=UPI00382DB05C